MKKKNLQTTLIHTGDNAMAKNAAASVSVPKVLPIHMTSVYSFDDVESLDAVFLTSDEG